MYLGIDFGMKRVGLSVAPDGGPAAPLEVIRWGAGMPIADEATLARVICDVAARERSTIIIVGLPQQDSHARQQIEQFITVLRSISTLEIITEDERLSTKLADRLTGYKGVAGSDAVAATVILDGYIERRKNLESRK